MAGIFDENAVYVLMLADHGHWLTLAQELRGSVQDAWETTRKDPSDDWEKQNGRSARGKMSYRHSKGVY